MSIASTSIRDLVSKVENTLGQGGIDLALRSIHDCVERIITEPLCVAQVFGSRELDRLCQDIGRKNLCQIAEVNHFPGIDSLSHPLVVHIVSRLQRSGGHSRLVQDFIRTQPEKNHLILSTEIGGPSDKDYLDKVFGSEENTLFWYAPRGSFAEKLTWLQSVLITAKPDHVNLLNHHQDSVVIAAVVPELKLKGSFYHHGDHHLCLGVCIGHFTHVDLHPVGYHVCRDDLGIDNHYLPLTFEDKGRLAIETDFKQGGCLTTATAARSNKVEIPYYVSYLDVIPQVLKATGGRHLHIGKLTKWGLRRIHSQMRKLQIPASRFVYIEWSPSVSKSMQEYGVDLYISPFPYGAGLTLVEVMGAGIPAVIHQHMYSRVLSALELAYTQAFSWATPEELLGYLKNLKPADLESQKNYARQRYEKFHNPSILQAYLSDPDSMRMEPPPLTTKYRPRYDEWAMWAERQLCLSRLAFRFAYRTARRLRNTLSSLF